MKIYSELKLVLRRLGKTPGFTAITLITLAIGIGANTAIFSVVEGVLLKPLPYPHSEQLIGLWHRAQARNGAVRLQMGPSEYFVYREQNRIFQDVGLYNRDSVSITGKTFPEQVPALDVTDGTLPILGARPFLGRLFNSADILPVSPDTVVLSYGYWQSHFTSSRNVIGQMVTIDGKPRQIIGIMPKEFHVLDWDSPAVFLPIQLDRNKVVLGRFSYLGLARLKPGVTLTQANADVVRMLAIVLRSFAPPPGLSFQLFEQARIAPDLVPLKQEVVGEVSSLLWILTGGIGCVLLIACANAANLLLVRVEGRQQEFAIRASLGAGRRRIAGDLLAETVVICLLSSVLGLGLAFGALRLLIALSPQGLPRLGEIGINLPVLAFTLAVALLASLLSGAVPIFKYASGRVVSGLRHGGRTQSQGRERHRARNILVILQVALAFVLLVCSGLMVRTFYALTRVNSGFSDPASVQSFRLAIPEAEVHDPESVVRMQQAIQEKIAAISGVSSVALSTSVPLDGIDWLNPLYVRDHERSEGDVPPVRRFKTVSPNFFRTLGIPLVAGRDFTWGDNYQRLPVAIVSENLARDYWRTPADALGKQIRFSSNDDWREIIGVVGSTHEDGMNQKAPTLVYWPILMKGEAIQVQRNLAFAVRTSRSGSQSLIREISDTVGSVDANLSLSDVQTLGYLYTKSMARTSFTLVMLGIAGAAGLLLGIVGLYSVIAYSVAQRRKEIGIRMALGAQREGLVNMFVRQGLLLSGAGVTCGLAAAAGLTRLMASLLFNVAAVDPITYVAVTLILVGTSVLASYAPSRRASKVDPMVALRYE